MQVIVNLLIKIFILLFFGFFIKKVGLITDEVQKALNQLLVKAILPITILMTSQNDYSEKLAGNMGITIIIAISYYIIAIFVTKYISNRLTLEEKKKHVFVTMIVFANVGFIGFPVVSELYGAEGNLYAIVYNMIYQIFFFTYGIALLSGEKNFKLRDICKIPVTIASFSCMILFFFKIQIPDGVASALSSIGNMTTPLSLILIGACLSQVKLDEILKDKYSYLVSFLKMIVYPIIVIAVLKVFNLPSVIVGTCAVLSALPSGSLNVIYAEQYDCESQFASRTVIQTMVFMVVTLPIMLILINYLV